MNTTDIADQSLHLVADIKPKLLLTKGVGNSKNPLVSNLKVVMRRCDVMGVCRGRDRGRVRACPPTPLSSVTCPLFAPRSSNSLGTPFIIHPPSAFEALTRVHLEVGGAVAIGRVGRHLKGNSTERHRFVLLIS